MASTEPTPYWGWVIKGHGGILKVMEDLLNEGCLPNETQAMCIEFQLARLQRVWCAMSKRVDGYEQSTARNLDALLEVRNFMGTEVLYDAKLEVSLEVDNPPSQIKQAWTQPTIQRLDNDKE